MPKKKTKKKKSAMSKELQEALKDPDVRDENEAKKDIGKGKIAGKLKGDNLNWRQERFCRYYGSDFEFFGSGVESYVEAYNIDLRRKGAYNSAKQCAYKLLTNVDILARLDEIIDHTINDTIVDKELAFVIKQNAELSSKVGAIREYNRVKSRVKKIIDINVSEYTDFSTDELLEELKKRGIKLKKKKK